MFDNWTEKRKQYLVIGGCLIGILAPLSAAAVTTHHASAAVAVIDQKNIEEAVKTAIQTAKILTTEQKELALKILDAKKLDGNMLAEWLKKDKETQFWPENNDEVTLETLQAMGKMPGILNKNTTPVNIFRNEIGTIEDAMTGKKTLYDLYMQTQKNHQALDATYQQAAATAAHSRDVTKTTNETVDAAVQAANNAEGQQQIMQAGIQIQAAQTLQGADTKELMAQLLAMQAEKWYVENHEKAVQETQERTFAQNAAAEAGL